VELVEGIHTIKVRKYSGDNLMEVLFEGEVGSCTTRSTGDSGNWSTFTLEGEEVLIGVYGEYDPGRKILNNLGFILAKLI